MVYEATAVAATGRDRWWTRLGVEHSNPVHRCAARDCETAPLAPTDVYCRTHEAFLPWGPRRPRWPHLALIGFLRIAIAAGFFFTALWDTMLPVWGVGLVGGLAVAVLPLRLYPLNARFAAAYWLVAALAGLELWHGYLTGPRELLTWSAYAALAGWWGFMALLASSGGGASARGAGRDRGARFVALTMTVTLPALGGAAVRPEWSDLFSMLALGGVIGAVVAAAVIGVLRGGRRPDAPLPPQVPYLSRPRSLRWRVPVRRPRPGRASGPVDRLARGCLAFAHAVLVVAVAASGRLASVARFLGFAIVFAATAAVNWVLWISVEASLRVVWSVISAALVLRAGLGVMWSTLVRSVRVVVFPLAVAACASVTIAWWAEAVRQYLAVGGAATLAWIGAGVVAAVAALTVVWVALSGLPLSVSLRSAVHSANVSSTKGLLVLAGFAWLLGLHGTVFGGPIAVGALTIGVTVLIAVAVLIHVSTRGRRAASGGVATSGADVPPGRGHVPEAAEKVRA